MDKILTKTTHGDAKVVFIELGWLGFWLAIGIIGYAFLARTVPAFVYASLFAGG